MLAVAGAAALGMSGCGGDENVTEATTVYMEPALTVTPDPVTAVPSTDPSTDPVYTWTARFTVTVAESGGVGGNITSVQATLNEASGGIEVVTTGEVVKTYFEAPEGDRVDALGSTSVNFTVDYTLPGGGREAVIDVYVSIESDEGAGGTLSERLSVI